MSTSVESSLGTALGTARAALGQSLQDVADAAGCSPAYVHKLEQDRVRTPSPRVLAGLAQALGLEYERLMRSAGYEGSSSRGDAPPAPRASNAHIVELLEALTASVAALRDEVAELRSQR
jgi:HTH-type transcriptional regulator, competence development regulator